MKLSKRNRERAANKRRKLKAGKPTVSKYAAKNKRDAEGNAK